MTNEQIDDDFEIMVGRALVWNLAEAMCVIELMLAECSVPCVADTHTDIECSITHLSPELCDRACQLFNDCGYKVS